MCAEYREGRKRRRGSGAGTVPGSWIERPRDETTTMRVEEVLEGARDRAKYAAEEDEGAK